MSQLLDTQRAAEYTELPLQFFRLQVRHGTGPAFVQPSARRRFFTKEALDQWMSTWKRGATTKTYAQTHNGSC
jgi:hypothetical protein